MFKITKKVRLLAFCCFLAATAFSQKSEETPGINYQAVARDEQGQILADKTISLRIRLYSGGAKGKAAYTEVHRIRTNEFGLFNLIVGKGDVQAGNFAEIPWQTTDIWMELALDDTGGENFTTLSSTRLMAVPYAFHALSADKLTGDDGQEKTAAYWKSNGNDQTIPGAHFVGTLDNKDLVFKTNNTERLRITAAGVINIVGNLSAGTNLNVGQDLTVGEDLTVNGIARFNNTTQSATKDDGAVIIEGGVGIEKNVNIGGNVEVDGTLGVDGITTSNNTTQSTTKDNGAVVIEGGVGIEKNLNIGGTFSAKGTSTSFMAYLENTSDSNGDGLEIKLGRNHPAWTGSAYLNLTSPGADLFDGAVNTVNGWIDGNNFEADDLLDIIPASYIAGVSCNLVNLLSDQLNESISLPLDFPELTLLPETEIFGGIDLDVLGSIPSLSIPEVTIPSFELIPEIPEIPCGVFPTFSAPVLSIVDVSNSLDKSNEFISFKDKDNRELGAVRAQSVSNWRSDFLDEVRVIDFMSDIVGIDFVQGIAKIGSVFTLIADSYNQIGVEYASGHGDYAEWLERINPNEAISAGDIVGVSGGKITKDLAQAEQIMAVSHKPIVLGNVPAVGREALGNKIAFMGQIPVKVQGPVNAGDYIVGNPATPGYGTAVAPSDMTAEKARLTVGRSWENKPNEGPKMVNTVIGVDNGNFLKIIQDNQHQVNELDARVRALEAKMEAMMNGAQSRAEATGLSRGKK